MVVKDVILGIGGFTNVKNRTNSPLQFALFQNYPNPFNPSTTIKYSLVNTGFVRLVLHDLLGKELKILVNEIKHFGNHELIFDGSDLISGVYFYDLKITNPENGKIQFTQARKLTLIK